MVAAKTSGNQAVSGMNKEQRLRSSRDFAAVRRDGRSRADVLLVLVSRPNNLDVTRFGFIVSKKVGNAVVRNRVRRRLKEAARLSQIECGWDLVFIARQGASSAEYQELSGSVKKLLARANVLDRSSGTRGRGAEVR